MEFFKNIRENLKDPKKKSLMLLGFYALFFVFVFLVLKLSGTTSEVYDEKIESTFDNFKNMNSYNFKINYYKQD